MMIYNKYATFIYVRWLHGDSGTTMLMEMLKI